MTERLLPPPPEVAARVRALADRVLTAEEVAAGLAARMNERELEEAGELIRWFRRRYPTPAARLAYARRAYARWAQAMPAGPTARRTP